jgi:peptidoglycan glycosyltransferase
MRDYKHLQKSQLRLTRKQPKVRPKFLRRVVLVLLVVCVAYFGVTAGWGALRKLWPETPKPTPEEPVVVVVPPIETQPEPEAKEDLDKKHLADMIGPRPLQPDELYTFRIRDENGHYLYVRTTLDPALQAWAVDLMPKVKASAAAIVAMDPRTGEVLAMASHRADGKKTNMALASSFPAASLFKIVTAAAAVEKEKMNSESTITYDGGKHTLYKKDVEKGVKKGRHKVTLKEGFADSINTVFGKLGAFTLGPSELKSFAERFRFNLPIEFEMPVQKSRFEAPGKEDIYGLAELASGFNRTTKVSPLHGAMLASAIVNDGKLMEPTVVREVFDLDNRIYYQHEPHSLGRVVSERTVRELRKLMLATISEGTGRRGFSDASKHKVLKRLNIGGKSGTINNDAGNKVDWFVCYGQKKGGGDAIALAGVVVHGSKLGMRSQKILREAMIQYFKPRLSNSGN